MEDPMFQSKLLVILNGKKQLFVGAIAVFSIYLGIIIILSYL